MTWVMRLNGFPAIQSRHPDAACCVVGIVNDEELGCSVVLSIIDDPAVFLFTVDCVEGFVVHGSLQGVVKQPDVRISFPVV